MGTGDGQYLRCAFRSRLRQGRGACSFPAIWRKFLPPQTIVARHNPILPSSGHSNRYWLQHAGLFSWLEFPVANRWGRCGVTLEFGVGVISEIKRRYLGRHIAEEPHESSRMAMLVELGLTYQG